MSNGFVLHLGGGTYLDVDGTVLNSPPDGAQVYPVPSGFFCETGRVRDSLAKLGGWDEPVDQNAWLALGAPTAQPLAFEKFSKAAKLLGKVNGVYGSIIEAALTLLSLLGAEDDGMNPKLTAALTDIKNQLQGTEAIILADAMLDLLSKFGGRVVDARKRLVQAKVEGTGADFVDLFADLTDIVDQLSEPMVRLLSEDWLVSTVNDAYKGRTFLAHLLVTRKADGSLVVLSQEPARVTTFDYRLGVPALLGGVATFAGLLATAMPWFRSAGMYSPQLRAAADAIDAFVMQMQERALARTEHSGGTILQHQVFPTFEIPMNNSNTPPHSLLPKSTYPAGAYDLVRYDDAFLTKSWLAAFQSAADLGRRGTFDYSWYSPLTWVGDIAAAANQQAAADYADLQVASGALQLLVTAAYLRHLSTPPIRSETVAGTVSEGHDTVKEVPHTATSPNIFPSVVVSAQATLRRNKAWAQARIRTHPPGYVPKFQYRVVLRTMESQSPFGPEAWDPQGYLERVWLAEYDDVSDTPRHKYLRTTFNASARLWELELYKGSSPSSLEPRGGEATISATTFDWYVPKLQIARPYQPIPDELTVPTPSGKPAGGTGMMSIHLRRGTTGSVVPMRLLHGHGSPFGQHVQPMFDVGVDYFGEAALDLAERRHVRQESVYLAWNLRWENGELIVGLSGKPDHRSFQVVVVVEETIYSGATVPEGAADILGSANLITALHTPFVAEIVNQTILVPESFFEQERNALDSGERMWDTYISKYAISAEVGPANPVITVLGRVRDTIARSPGTATLAESLHTRMEVARQANPALFEEVLREAAPRAAE